MFDLFVFAFIGTLVFLLSLITIHFIDTELQWKKDALSKYALGGNGWLLSLGLYSVGFAQIFLSIGLTTIYSFSLAYLFLVNAGLGAIIVAMFKMDLVGTSISGRVHRFGAGIQFFFFPVSLLLLSSSFFGSTLHTVTLFIGSISLFLLLLIFYYAFAGTTHTSAYFGIIQKVNILFMALWMLLISFFFAFRGF